MKIVFKVNPPCAPRFEFMDSKQPQIHSLKYKITKLLSLPDEFLLNIRGVYSEVLLERIRSVHYPNLPSRLSAVFVFENLQYAKRFKFSGWIEKECTIYAYNIENLYSPPFCADMCLTNVLSNVRMNWERFKNKKSSFIKSTLGESLEFICHSYWQGKTSKDLGLGDGDSLPEILLNAYLKPISFIPLS